MILFKELSYKNFLSAGDNPIWIDLNKAHKTLISGKNGNGKSQTCDAIAFALYGKPYRNINKNQIVNSINGKYCEVSLSLEIDGSSYKIIRGISPGKFEIYKDGILISQDASIKDYQKKFESDILRMSYNTFKQIVVLGSGTSTSFMKLNPAQRRDFLEEVLDLKILTRMSKKVKEKYTALCNREEISKKNIQIYSEYLSNINSSYNSTLFAIQKEKEKEKQNQQKISNEISEKVFELDKWKSDYDILEKVISKLNFEHKPLYNFCLTETQRLLTLKGRLDSHINSNICTYCNSPLSEDKISEHREKHSQDYETYLKDEKELHIKAQRVQDLFDKIEKANDLRISNLQRQGILKSEIDSLKQISSQNIDISSLEKLLSDQDQAKEEYLNKIDLEKKSLDLVYEALSYFGFIDKSLKDDGIRAYILSKFIPRLNSRVNHYLNEMDFFVSFYLSNSLEEVIKSRHRDEYSYENFSQGERQRIDLALLFAWRDLAREKNSISTNLLILDETFDSSLDIDGVESLQMCLNTLPPEERIFVISHSGSVHESQFNRMLTFEKINNFSNVTEH